MEQEPRRPVLSIVEDLSSAEAAQVQRSEVLAAAIISQWLTYMSSARLPTAALDEATRAVFRILAACDEDQSDRPIPPIVGIVQDSQIDVNPRESVCLLLMDYMEEFFIEQPFAEPGVESDVLASLLVAYCSPWAQASSIQDRLVSFFRGYSSCSSLHQLMVAEAFEKVIPRFSTLHDVEMLQPPFYRLIIWIFKWTHPAAQVRIWPEARREVYNAHFPLGSHLITLITTLVDKPKGAPFPALEYLGTIICDVITSLDLEPDEFGPHLGVQLAEVRKSVMRLQSTLPSHLLGPALAAEFAK